MFAALFGVYDAELFVFLNKIHQGLGAGKLVGCGELCLEAEPLVNLTKIIQGLVADVHVCCYELCVGGIALGVSDQD